MPRTHSSEQDGLVLPPGAPVPVGGDRQGRNVVNVGRTKWQEPGDLWRAEVDSGLSQLPHLGGPGQSKGLVAGS